MRYLILLVLLYLLYYFFKKAFLPARRQEKILRRHRVESAGKELVQDPQCHTYIPKETSLKAQINGEVYYFCSRECLEKFKRGT